MKEDLVSLFVAQARTSRVTIRMPVRLFMGGILRVLQNNKPATRTNLQTHELMTWNFFLETETQL